MCKQLLGGTSPAASGAGFQQEALRDAGVPGDLHGDFEVRDKDSRTNILTISHKELTTSYSVWGEGCFITIVRKPFKTNENPSSLKVPQQLGA